MTAWLKKDREHEIELNDEPDTIKQAVAHDWVMKSEYEGESKPVEEMEIDELHAIAKEKGKPMAANIGLENARKKVAAMLEGE